MKITTKNSSFYAEFNVLSPLEWLDLEVNEEDSDAYIIASEVALAVTDWNGLGKVDPLWLLSDRSNHNRVFMVSSAIDRTRQTIPKFEIDEQPDLLVFHNKDFFCKVKNLTVLEFMGILSQTRKTYGDDLRSRFKCEGVASVIVDWNGIGSITAEQLLTDKDSHPYVVGLDLALANFFRQFEEYTISDDAPILDDGNDNGGDVFNESGSLESAKNSHKGFSVDVAGISRG